MGTESAFKLVTIYLKSPVDSYVNYYTGLALQDWKDAMEFVDASIQL